MRHIYLCCNPSYAQLFFDFCNYKALGTEVVFCHPDRERYKAVCDIAPPGVPVHNITSRVQRKATEFGDRFVYWANHPRPNFALACKTLLPILFEPPFLFTDDDVMIWKTHPMMTRGEWCTKGTFNVSGNKKLCDSLSDVFEVNISPEFYSCYALDMGIWRINERRDWEELLHKFVKCRYFKETGLDTHGMRVMDLRFLTGFGARYGWESVTGADVIRIAGQAPEKCWPNCMRPTVFLHYCASKHKHWYVRNIRKYLEGGEVIV